MDKYSGIEKIFKRKEYKYEKDPQKKIVRSLINEKGTKDYSYHEKTS